MAPPSSPPAAGKGVNMVKSAQLCVRFVVDVGAFCTHVLILEVRDHS